MLIIFLPANELSNGEILVLVCIQSTTGRNVQINNIDLQCQPGFQLHGSALHDLGILPLSIGPYSHCNAVFEISLTPDFKSQSRPTLQAMTQRTGKLDPSELLVEYSVLKEDMNSTALPLIALENRAGPHSTRTFAGEDKDVRAPVLSEYQQLLEKERDDAFTDDAFKVETRDNVFTHSFSLQLSSLGTESHCAFVSIRMLGPFSVTIGNPISLCWQLERVGNIDADNSHSSSVLSFDVMGDKNVWSPGKISGRVRLGLQNGAVATVESTWVPSVLGTVVAPSLRLHDVHSQDVHEIGTHSNLIIVR